jgi:AcrR family transcriptional regulator
VTVRTGRPPVTSRAEILEAACRLIDRAGWEKLTVRGLAAALGVGPATLYRHVRDKEALLLLLLSEYVGQIARPELPSDPRERIVLAITALHDALAAWPWAAEVLTTDGFVGQLDESALWTVETVVAGAIDAGCTPERAVAVFRSLWFYTVGEILVRAHSPRAVSRPAPDDFLAGVDPARLPRLAELGEQWPVLAEEDTYPAGLRAFVDGLLGQARIGSWT